MLFWIAVFVLSVLQLVLPERIAFVPLLVAACHVGPTKVFGGFNCYRLLIVIGLLRAFATPGAIWGRVRWSSLDTTFLCFALIAIGSGAWHNDLDGNPYIFRLGLVIDVVGSFLYARAFISDRAAVERFIRCVALVLVPLALLLLIEVATGTNPYYLLGSGVQGAGVRLDRVRALGPFRHPILTGTAGATVLPLMLWLYTVRPVVAMVGIVSALVVVLASASSGPIGAMTIGLGITALWTWRTRLSPTTWEIRVRLITSGIVAILVAYPLIYGSGPWYLLARFDLVGGSTGWHRAYLIDQAFQNLPRWWLAGTDYTRDWMYSGVEWSENHVDITNYYIHLGVIGGLPLAFCLVNILRLSFRSIRNALPLPQAPVHGSFLAWTLGAALSIHAISFVSVSYLGQMFALFYMVVGCVLAVSSDTANIRPLENTGCLSGEDGTVRDPVPVLPSSVVYPSIHTGSLPCTAE